MLLKAVDLSVSYKIKSSLLGRHKYDYNVIKNINFEVYRGETLGIVGESGCGKTTIGKVITQLLDGYSGNIIFERKNISGLSKREKQLLKKDIQIIFQDPYSSLDPGKTVGYSVKEPLEVYNMCNKKDRKEYVVNMLAQVGLEEDICGRYPHELSGGQRQRVCIARVLAVKPKLIICDESVSALDVSIQAQVLNLLNDLKEKYNLTYIFISHDLSVVRYMSDRIIVLRDGNIAECGQSDAVYNNPKSEYTKFLMDSVLR